MTDKTDIQIELARERTPLARERTILAHIRTGFASFLFGAVLLGLFGATVSFVGGGFILIGVVLFLRVGSRMCVVTNGLAICGEVSTVRSTGTGSTALYLDERLDSRTRNRASPPSILLRYK
ncbi:DUF202 domain-containing protein [Halorarum halobium]|uniref:DUF202 domain-containing protein n=1 Tax=Halorarum halobium TaxID=3075121 RepID=UPI0028ABD29C|nr:DUF202 domain-containing protein [Halobaculum sp. XH14]